MANQIKLKNGSGSNPSASDLIVGEVALRTDNASLFTKKDDGTIAEIGAAAGVSDGDKGDITVSNSGSTFTVDNGVISTAKIANDAVTTDKINANAITATEISNGVITNDKIASNAAIAVSKLSGVMPSGGGTFSGNISFSDNRQIKLGSSDDLVLFHDGNNSFIKDSGTGGLFIQGSGGGAGITLEDPDGNDFIKCIDEGTGGAVELYKSGNKKFETITAGVKVSAGNLYLDRDNAKVVFGAGDDLEIYHNSGFSYIDAKGDQLRIDADQLRVRSDSGESYIEADANSAVKLYYNNVKKLATTANGIKLDDDTRIGIGDGEDLQLYHEAGAHSFIKNTSGRLRIIGAGGTDEDIQINAKDGEFSLRAVPNAQVEAYYDNAKKFNTESNGVTVTGRILVTGNNNVGLIHQDGVKAVFGNSNDLQVYHNGSNSFIQDQGTGDLFIDFGTNIHLRKYEGGGVAMETVLKGTADGSVELYHDNNKKLHTISSGIIVTGDVLPSSNCKVNDGGGLIAGSGNDLIISHDGTNSFITDGGNSTGLVIKTPLLAVKNAAGSENMLVATQDGSVELMHNNSKKIETSSSGVSVTGNIVVSGNVDGRNVGDDGTKLDTIETNATADQTASEILTLIKTVDGGGSGLDADTLDGIQFSSFLRSDLADTASADITFSGGAGAATIGANSDIRFTSGNWTGNAAKIQNHGNALYIQGGSASDYNIILRSNSGNDRLYMSGGGVLYPTVDNSQDLGKSSKRFANVFAGAFYGDGSNLTGISSTNNFVSSASFNTGNGVLTLNRSGLGAVTVDLDGRFATGTIPTNNNQLSNGAGYLTTVHSARSAAANGYVRYRDGTQIAYGNVTLNNSSFTTKSFAAAFPSSCRAVVIIPNDSTATAAAQRNPQVRSVNRSNFQAHSGQHTNPCNHFYIALGH